MMECFTFAKSILRRRWVWSIGGRILTRWNHSTWKDTCPSATFSTTNSYGLVHTFLVGSQQLIARAMIQPFLKAGCNLNYTKNQLYLIESTVPSDWLVTVLQANNQCLWELYGSMTVFNWFNWVDSTFQQPSEQQHFIYSHKAWWQMGTSSDFPSCTVCRSNGWALIV